MCNGSFPVGDADRRSATIHSGQAPKSHVKNGLLFREKNVLTAEQPSDREGKTDYTSPLSLALGLLGETQSEAGPEIGLEHQLPEAAKMKQTNKAPVFVTAAKAEMVHEPNEGVGCIPVDMTQHKVFNETFPEPQ